MKLIGHKEIEELNLDPAVILDWCDRTPWTVPFSRWRIWDMSKSFN